MLLQIFKVFKSPKVNLIKIGSLIENRSPERRI